MVLLWPLTLVTSIIIIIKMYTYHNTINKLSLYNYYNIITITSGTLYPILIIVHYYFATLTVTLRVCTTAVFYVIYTSKNYLYTTITKT